MKVDFENRIYAVTNYTGSDDLVKALENSLFGAGVVDGETPGGREGSRWVVASACMAPAEYRQFGQHGKPWRFMDSYPDVAARCVEIKRKVVEKHCRIMGLNCDWSRIFGDRPGQAA